MKLKTILIHHGPHQPLWEQPGMIQAGLQVSNGPQSLHLTELTVDTLSAALQHRGWNSNGVLLQFTDPFLLRRAPMRGIRKWRGPRILACGDLHHGPAPIETLKQYCIEEPHDTVLLTFNPAMLEEVQQQLSIPVRCLAPTFFRYPSAKPKINRRLQLLHVGSLGPHHPRRREIVQTLLRRNKVPFQHATTRSAEEAAELYTQHALVLNVPLNQDLNHRLFEVMAAGVPQVIFGHPRLLGHNSPIRSRQDLFWVQSIVELEELVKRLFADSRRLNMISVESPPYWNIEDLLKKALAP